MNMVNACITVGLCAAMSLTSVAAVSAQEKPRFDEGITVTAAPKAGSPSDYYLTFNRPTGIPRATLEPGTYLFRFPMGFAGGVIQVLSPNRADVYAMFMTIPATDLHRGMDNAHFVKLGEELRGMPPAIKKWFVPYREDGFEFVYD